MDATPQRRVEKHEPPDGFPLPPEGGGGSRQFEDCGIPFDDHLPWYHYLRVGPLAGWPARVSDSVISVSITVIHVTCEF